MKSESSKKMMLRHIIIFSCCISFTIGESQSPYSLSKVPKKSELKYSKLSTTLDLKNKQFYSSKERPELNPVLSALINEDIKKSIDAKRHAEATLEPTTTAAPATTTTAIPVLTTTTRKSLPKSVNDGLSGDPESLDEAGSENKQTSRIQVKKGPNGVDYEYEYVYYYYDDDEKDTKKTTVAPSSSTTTERAQEKDVVRPTGKNRYTSLDRNGGTTSKPATAADPNEIPSSRGKGRQVIPVVEEVVEERLPANTRFPPRNLATPSVSVVSTIDETTKKISVKRPSLELVDSHSFNRGDKTQTKGSRVIESEFSRDVELKDKSVIPLSATTSLLADANESAASSTSSAVPPTAPSNDEPTTAANEWPELTTQIMDRVALDLYAHLVNENSIADATTTPDNDDGTDALAIVTTDASATTTIADDYTTYIAPVQSTTTTTTTTEAATTPAPTTTTTTTEAALLHGRKSPFSGRNRFRLKPSAAPAAETEERKDAASESSALKPKNRFSRPTYSRSRPAVPTAAANAAEETVAKEEKTAVAASPIRGRTRSRFNLRTSSANNGTTSSDETADNVAAGQSTTTQRTARPRPSFNLRGRSRPTPLPVPSTAAASAAEETAAADNESPAAGGVEPKPDDEKAAVAAKPASRFNLRRPNQLLSARGRVSPLLKASTEAPAKSDDATDAAKEVTAVIANDNRNKEAPSDEGDQANTETSTQPQSGLNRLRNRPRIQIKPRASTSSENKSSTLAAYNVNRKANPLIARRKIGSTTSTTEEPIPQDETTVKDDGAEGDADDYAKDEQTEAAVAEVTSEQPRSLGILGNRRRVPLRKPGTILHSNQN